MPYRIYCRKTWKLLAVYQNEETLKALDLNRCSYEWFDEKPKKLSNNTKSNSNGFNRQYMSKKKDESASDTTQTSFNNTMLIAASSIIF